MDRAGAFPRLETALDEGPISPDRLAAALGITRTELDDIRDGQYAAIEDGLKARIAAVLDVPVVDLFERSETTVRLVGSSTTTPGQYRTVTAIVRRAS
jgi:DNA-binding Xre family transcriptional regulator